jgi:hypothetical protein
LDPGTIAAGFNIRFGLGEILSMEDLVARLKEADTKIQNLQVRL